MTMPKNHLLDVRKRESSTEHQEPLLSSSNDDDAAVAVLPLLSRRLPPITRPQAQGLPRTPRTPNRVRFELAERRSSEHEIRDEAGHGAEEDNYHSTGPNGSAGQDAQRLPLLTAIEAPSVTVANCELDYDDQVEDLLENNARPKSGMISAFMNMANSIM